MTEISKVLPSVNSGFMAKWQDPAIRGALFKVSSCLCFSGINGFVRYLALTAKETGATPLPAPEIAFFEALFALFFLLPWLMSTGKSAFQTKNSFRQNLTLIQPSKPEIML